MNNHGAFKPSFDLGYLKDKTRNKSNILPIKKINNTKSKELIIQITKSQIYYY